MTKGNATVVVFLALVLTHPASAQTPPYTPEQLAALPWDDLDRLYRAAEPGRVPDGFARGRVVYPPWESLATVRAGATGLFWRGKHFSAAEGTLINQWPAIRAIRANIAPGPSWLDGRPALILDYADTSRWWRDVRDEMREVTPGLYLGAMFLRDCPAPRQKLFFILQADTGCR